MELTKEKLIAQAEGNITILRTSLCYVKDPLERDDIAADLRLAEIALALLEAECGKIRRFDLDMSDCDSCGQDCGADMIEDLDGEYVLWDEVQPYIYRYYEYTALQAAN